MKRKLIIIILSFALGIGLVYIGLKLFLTADQLTLLLSKPFTFHFYSCLLILPIYLLGGIETYTLFNIVYQKKIKLYDVLTLPFVINLWGFLIPFQGSFIYNSVYFKAKYKISIANSTSVFLVSLSVSFILAGILGIVYSCFVHQNIYFLLLSIASFAHLLFVFIFLKILRKFKSSNYHFIKNIMTKAETIVADYINALNTKTIIVLIVLNLINSLALALWLVWVAKNFGFDLSFFQLLLFSFLIKLTLLIKLTPGNIGINQFASSGIIMLVGGVAASGFTLSLYQTAIFIITSFLIGSIFSIVNIPYFFPKAKDAAIKN